MLRRTPLPYAWPSARVAVTGTFGRVTHTLRVRAEAEKVNGERSMSKAIVSRSARASWDAGCAFHRVTWGMREAPSRFALLYSPEDQNRRAQNEVYAVAKCSS